LASDMWSIGVITYVLLSGISPFIGTDDQDTLLNVSEAEYNFDETDETKTAFRNISNDAKDFIDGLLKPTPRDRLNVTACLNHKWITVDGDAASRNIDLHNLREFLKKRKEKPAMNSNRAVRRFSSFAVGPKKGPAPMRSKAASPFLNVPSLSSHTIQEEDEDEEESVGGSSSGGSFNDLSGPRIVIDDVMTDDDAVSRSSSAEPPTKPPSFDENQGDLRDYLRKMIDGGHLPGSGGSFDVGATGEFEGNESDESEYD